MTTTLSPIDQNALTRALVIARAESGTERARFDDIEAQYGWREAGERAAYHLQVKTLRLKPWHCPPCDCRSDEVGHGYGHSRVEVMLRRRMLEAGLSLYEPDPVAALERVEAVERAENAPAPSVQRPQNPFTMGSENKVSAPAARLELIRVPAEKERARDVACGRKF